MFRAIRMVTAAALALAVAALPVVLDRCAESCDPRHDAVAAAPACHHVASAAAGIRPVPRPCGHDHRGPRVTPAQGPRLTDRAFDSIVAAVALPAALASAVSDRGPLTHAPPGLSPSVPDHRSLPLRI